MKKVLVTQKIPTAGISILENAGFTVIYHESHKKLTKSELIEKAAGVDAILCLLSDNIDSDVISSLRNCIVIANYAVGFNNIDIKAASDRGITITNTPDVLTDAVAELTVCLMIAASRNLLVGDRIMRSGQFKGWESNFLLGKQISTSKIGLIGAGRIATAVAKILNAMNAEIIYSSRRRNAEIDGMSRTRFAELDELLRESDIVSIHTPLKDDTRNLISAERLELMKQGAIFVNTARGEVTDEKHLIQMLKSGRLSAAALDVYLNEPDVNPEFFTLENVILAPHIGSATETARNRMAEIAAENIVNVLNGKKALTPVN